MSHKAIDILSLLLTDFSKYKHVYSFFLSVSFSSSFFVLCAGSADNHCYKPITHINHSNSQVFCFKIWHYGQISPTHLRGPLSFIFKFLSFLMALSILNQLFSLSLSLSHSLKLSNWNCFYFYQQTLLILFWLGFFVSWFFFLIVIWVSSVCTVCFMLSQMGDRLMNDNLIIYKNKYIFSSIDNEIIM